MTNWRERIFSNEKPKSFQGPKAGPGPQPIRAHFICTTPLHGVGKNRPKKFGAPLTNPGSAPIPIVTQFKLQKNETSYFAGEVQFHKGCFAKPTIIHKTKSWNRKKMFQSLN